MTAIHFLARRRLAAITKHHHHRRLLLQHSEPIVIGAYCFVGSNYVILGGSALPDHCVLGALSLLNKAQTESRGLYAGQPAIWRKAINRYAIYVTRKSGLVV